VTSVTSATNATSVTRARIAIWVAGVAGVALLVLVLVAGLFAFGVLDAPWLHSSSRGALPPSTVVVAVRDLSRLESASYHMAKVVELTDQQSKLFGLLTAKDAILLVAEGDVVAGVDLSKLGDADVRVDPDKRGARVRLPAPEVFSASLDDAHTHVYERTTDALASRNEQLEGKARREAEAQMRQGAIDAGILGQARANAERTVRSLLRGLGFDRVDVEWAG
jgi:hypothetical protein